MKPREWTLEWDRDNQRWRFISWSSGNDSDYNGIHPKFVHVIEKSAYDELKAALEFYAKPESHWMRHDSGDGFVNRTDVDIDGGNIAREALLHVGGKLMAWQCTQCNHWTADGENHQCVMDENKKLRERVTQLETTFKNRQWMLPLGPDPDLADDEWWAVFPDHNDKSLGTISKTMPGLMSNNSALIKVKRPS